MLKNLLLLLTIFTGTSLYAQVWDGSADGTSWNIAENWSDDTIPGENAVVSFPSGINVTITGSAPNSVARINFESMTTVTFDLDLNITSGIHNMVLGENANVTLGGTTEVRTFNFMTSSSRNSILLNSDGGTLTITEQTTLNMNNSESGIRVNGVDASLINNGTLNIANYVEHGILVSKGAFTNNSTISIGTGMGSGEEGDGIYINNDGVFDNNATGTITVTKPLDDGLEIFGVFNNAGTISNVSKDDAIGTNSGIVVGSTNIEGTLNNMASGIINADGGIGESARAFSIQGSGIFNNAGEVNVSGGNLGQSLFNLGILTNEICGHINMIETRISNSNAGMITNNGLISSTYTAAGVSNNAMDGSALNNAFYGYANANADFSGGNVESTDNGQKTGTGIVVDAAGSCTVADIGIDVPYTWYTDLTGSVEAGTNDANGMLALNDDIFAESGMQTLYTCFGEAVQLNIQNVGGDCALVNGIDFIQLTDVFTMMPNPAQTFTLLKFGNEYIAEEKTIEVYNAVGQLVQSADLNNADNYILQTNNLAVGIYTINLQTERGMQVERLIIQK